MPDVENGVPERQPLGAPCRYCGSPDTWIEWRLEAKPVGSFSLAGAQMKFSAGRWPYAVCDGCGHVSRGEPTSPIPPGTYCPACMEGEDSGLAHAHVIPPAEPTS